jgi:hypothetical protein
MPFKVKSFAVSLMFSGDQDNFQCLVSLVDFKKMETFQRFMTLAAARKGRNISYFVTV